MNNSSVSVILPTFNRAHLLERALKSVLGQLEIDDEIIVVDDGSTDNTHKVIKSLADNIRYFQIEKSGAGAARNFGIMESRNPLVAFIDSDDEWMPGKVLLQKKMMIAKPELIFCFTNFAIRDRKNREIRFAAETWSKDTRKWDEIIGPGKKISTIFEISSNDKDYTYHEGDIFLQELLANYINVNTLMVRKSLAGDALFFAEGTKTYEDWECFGRLSSKGPAIYIDCETAWQHGHFGPRLTDTHPVECAIARIPIIEEVWGLNEDFQKMHGPIYEKTLAQQYAIVVRGMIARGKIKTAREYIKKYPNVPFNLKIIASLPRFLVAKILAFRRKFR